MKLSAGFPVLLTILFIGLKLCNIITWSWVWVLSPMWINILLAIVTIILFVVIYAIVRV